jgi:hypothetical protein
MYVRAGEAVVKDFTPVLIQNDSLFDWSLSVICVDEFEVVT